MTFTPTRRDAVITLLSALAAGAAQAQAFPSRPVRLVVNNAPGGGTDIMARVVAEAMRADLGQAVVVENRPGAGGALGAAEVARAPADGHTLLVSAAAFVIGPSVLKSPGYDPVKDFVGVAQFALVPLLVLVPPNSRFKTLKDVIDAGRRGENLSFASFGNATPSHLIGAMINHHARIKMLHVPYRGGMAALPDLTAGSVDLALLDAVSMSPLVKDGRLRALAVTGPRRLPAQPDLPTLVELGIPFDAVGWHAAFAPAGTPPAVVARLNAAFVKALARTEIRERIVNGGSVPIEPALTAEQWTEQSRREVAQWAEAVRTAAVEPT
ncbi:tripartite tricarboxylate transporter substrate-binding protein [Pseudorhodoferax sp.]|uniref:tripartite tricarboxylate transporter substrate-binding protein n=1 Tax=Pseudorhodoferax sp. TaxID=1993553 RepID=UPI002DD61EA7|nr:tripartite tricarboxylate transporter substrate-binding protein [Pseudorhodoferax sp.]